jgi:hypothetical protein
MKILNYLKSAKGKLIKFPLIMGILLFSCFNSFTNPTSLPPAITELYFYNNEFYIELFLEGEENLNNMRITGLYDTAEFKSGLVIIPGQVTVVNKFDFQTPFYINPEGDCLVLEIKNGNYWYDHDWYGFCFGDVLYCNVSAPLGEESIAFQCFSDGYWEDNQYWLVKELPNSINYSPYQVSKRAEFSGYVRDKNDEPLVGIKLHYTSSYYFYYSYTPHVPEIFTDENGYFHTNGMFCKKYYINFLLDQGEIGDTMIFIEPDSANYFEFKLDTLLTGIADYKPAISNYSISNIPNPFSNNTSFVIQTIGILQNQKGVIKIYNSEGYIVDILPIEISGEKQEVHYSLNDKSLAAGIYYYSLEIGRKKVASGKMMISQ